MPSLQHSLIKRTRYIHNTKTSAQLLSVDTLTSPSMLSSPVIWLRDGAEFPQIGMGTWKHNGEKASEAVYTGLKNGYRLMDGACGAWLLYPVILHWYLLTDLRWMQTTETRRSVVKVYAGQSFTTL